MSMPAVFGTKVLKNKLQTTRNKLIRLVLDLESRAHIIVKNILNG